MQSKHPLLGIVPAGGTGSRLHPFKYAKELLPIGFEFNEEGSARPRLIIEIALRAMLLAGVQNCFVVVSPSKPELLKVLGDGSELGLRLAYVNQVRPGGLLRAIAAATPWTDGHYCCMALPDTQFHPAEAIQHLFQELQSQDADLALGVFPTDHPEQLGPVHMTPEGQVVMIEDKPKSPTVFNTWGTAVWSPNFSKFLEEQISLIPEEEDIPLGTIFNRAIAFGLKVCALTYPDGAYCDAGTPQGLYDILNI